MNKISIVVTMVLLMVVSITIDSYAQKKGSKKVKTNYNKETGPPPWAPAHGYRAKTRYVYFTDHNFYYDNDKGVYIYLSGKNWEVSAKIPDLFKNVNLAAEVKIDLDFSADNPHQYNADHKRKYKKG